jgi:heme exporter protein A
LSITTEYSVELNELVKYFGRRLVFEGLNYKFLSGNTYGISGPNGSGKSTLAKIIANLITPTRGSLRHKCGEREIEPGKLHDFIGFVSPYLYLYDEFTAEENLIHFSAIRGMKYNGEKADFLFNGLSLLDRKNDRVGGYSSGMKQRLKYISALIHNPRLLILDEPTSNLDNPGKEKVYSLITEAMKENLVIIASNENSDLELCSEVLSLEAYKRRIRR